MRASFPPVACRLQPYAGLGFQRAGQSFVADAESEASLWIERRVWLTLFEAARTPPIFGPIVVPRIRNSLDEHRSDMRLRCRSVIVLATCLFAFVEWSPFELIRTPYSPEKKGDKSNYLTGREGCGTLVCMPRTARVAPGGVIFHVLNRGNAREEIFHDDGDYAAMEQILGETQEHIAVRILGYCLMPNHWHLVLWPTGDGDLGRFMQRLTTTHVRRWHLHRGSVGSGHLYQGTYKSFPIQSDGHLYTVLRYVERNPVRPTLVARAEEWRWSSLWRRLHAERNADGPVLSTWPVARPADWLTRVNRELTKKDREAIQASLVRGRPFGGAIWQKRTAQRLGLESTFRPRGRPCQSGPTTKP